LDYLTFFSQFYAKFFTLSQPVPELEEERKLLISVFGDVRKNVDRGRTLDWFKYRWEVGVRSSHAVMFE
jgi:hypothetical protein